MLVDRRNKQARIFFGSEPPVPPDEAFMLTEEDSFILLETDDKILLEG